MLPLVLLDLWVTVFQALSFRIYGIPTVRRRQDFVIDRHKLAYLNGIEKLHCFYCSDANGLLRKWVCSSVWSSSSPTSGVESLASRRYSARTRTSQSLRVE